ncbi:integral membrane sensor signal transduction histidine kinase [Chlorella sorokiniana]|uniref:Integral membrane sensor signal transduction histidine kinase n=1 Tax=Chlorella sorokiniana TaxID=3076 RepID=A0A2P6TQ08_CHLSO|nr:integral membrane sensor signal transduction histidine kinase [Chlorella sorokiniana]|eukprot:PRW56121.1 integral membrane sensor signal transduction histidine kinase [Chlorella sorokiniana]
MEPGAGIHVDVSTLALPADQLPSRARLLACLAWLQRQSSAAGQGVSESGDDEAAEDQACCAALERVVELLLEALDNTPAGGGSGSSDETEVAVAAEGPVA